MVCGAANEDDTVFLSVQPKVRPDTPFACILIASSPIALLLCCSVGSQAMAPELAETAKTLTIFCMVLTTPANQNTLVKAIAQTWGA